MSRITAGSSLERCRNAALDAAWSQWSVLGGRVGGRIAVPRAVVDPEALLLFSCALRDDEPRLWDLVGGLLAAAPSLLSVQRTRNLAARFPARVSGSLAEAAAIATADGKDARWKPLAAGAHRRPYRGGKLGRPAPRIAEPAGLMLRLRLAFGVHARSDVLSFLLATAPSAASAREIAEATGYGPVPAHRALAAMATARVVGTEGSRPERYHADAERWAGLLGAGVAPVWRHWHALFAFLAAALASAHGRAGEERSPYLRSGEVRRLVLEHRAAFALNRIAIPDPGDYPGEAFLAGYDRALEAVTTWLEGNV